jgi:hypothetical protein
LLKRIPLIDPPSDTLYIRPRTIGFAFAILF